MGWTLREPNQDTNPTLPGGVYGEYITAGRMVYWYFDGARTRVVLFIADGGIYGLDAVHELSYNGTVIPPQDFVFHRGTYTKQIDAKTATGVNVDQNTIIAANHGLPENTLIRLKAIGGALPLPLSENAKYRIKLVSDGFSVADADTDTIIDLTTPAYGSLKFWKADAGFDDPEQGLPKFCPEVDTTFSGIGYVELLLPVAVSENAEPAAENFRIVGRGRRLMDYDAAGNELGVIAGDGLKLSNPALQLADCLFNEYQKEYDRLDFESWYRLKTDAPYLIWQRANLEANEINQGLTGRYYQNSDFTDLRFTRLDPTVDLSGVAGTEAPAPNVSASQFSVRWNGRIKPRYSGVYTFIINHDDGAKLIINGQTIVDAGGAGSSTGYVAMTANALHEIQVEHFNTPNGGNPNPYNCQLRWESPSQANEIVPSSRLYPADTQNRRYECHTAFVDATEAATVWERLMERCPGWHWTDKNGKIVFLPPDRPIEFVFVFDALDESAESTIVEKSFQKRKRLRKDRKSFRLFSFRNIQATGYPKLYIEGNRERLRELAGGRPDNDPAQDLGVSNFSLATRMAEQEMVFKTDPNFTYTLKGNRASTILTKGMCGKIFYRDENDNFVAEDYVIVTATKTGGNIKGECDFTLLPVPYPFYTDEPVSDQNSQGVVANQQTLPAFS